MTSDSTVSASPSGFADHPVLHIAIIVIVVVAVAAFLIVRRRRS